MLETQTAGGVVLNKNGDILVVNQNSNSWSLPKGHIDPGEDALTAAEREIKEESGITDLKYIRELGSYQRYRMAKDVTKDTNELKNLTFFLFRTDQMDLLPIDPVNPEARWINREEVVNLLTHQKDKEFWLSVKDKLV